MDRDFSNANILILGIGNLLWADEGFGVRTIEALQQQYDIPENITLLDGGTQGMYLVPYVQEADVLIVFDAIDYGLAPGTMKLVNDDDVPKFMGAKKMSLHQTGFQEVLATADLLNAYPEKVLLIGVQPVTLDDYGGSLRPEVKQQIQPAIDQAIIYLASLGVVLSALEKSVSEPVNHHSLNIDKYEAQRPTETQACRIGDARVLSREAYVSQE